MATTLDNIATWAMTTMMKRDDLTTEAREAAKGVYLLVCQKIPFEALQKRSAELPMQANVDTYDLASGPTVLSPDLAGIMSIRYSNGTRKWRWKRSHSRLFDSISVTTSSDPRLYARFGTTIEVHPPPSSSAATFRVRYWSNPTLVASPNEHTTTLVTPVAWDELFKWETLYRLYFITGQEDKAAQLIMPMPMPRQMQPKRTQMFEVGIIPRLWNDLLATINMREAVDEDFSVNPIRREYTSA